MRRTILAAVLTFFFIVESIIVELMPEKVFMNERIVVPHLLLIGIILLTIYVNRNYGLIFAFVFGLLFDVVYTEIIGIYLVLFPVIAYLVSKLMGILQTNLFIIILVSMLGVVLVELGAYEMNFLIHKTDMSFVAFLNNRLVPTIVLNFLITLIIAYPISRLFDIIGEQLRNE